MSGRPRVEAEACWAPTGGLPARVQGERVLLAVVAQLELLGGLTHWALYVACHLPDAHRREETLRSLLCRHAQEWAAEPQLAHGFLVERLGVPSSWLAGALAVWAHYRRRPGGAPIRSSCALIVPPHALCRCHARSELVHSLALPVRRRDAALDGGWRLALRASGAAPLSRPTSILQLCLLLSLHRCLVMRHAWNDCRIPALGVSVSLKDDLTHHVERGECAGLEWWLRTQVWAQHMAVRDLGALASTGNSAPMPSRQLVAAFEAHSSDIGATYDGPLTWRFFQSLHILQVGFKDFIPPFLVVHVRVHCRSRILMHR